MWNSPMGCRTCFGTEATLIRRAIADLVACLDEEARTEERSHGARATRMQCGVPEFDRLAWHQRLALLAEVGRALLCEDQSPRPTTAIFDGTIAALYGYISYRVDGELEAERSGNSIEAEYRKLVEATYEHVDPQQVFLDPWPDFESDATFDWQDAIERLLVEFVVNSKAHFVADSYLDADPDDSWRVRESSNLPDDYFTAIAPDPTPAEIEQVRETLKNL